MKMINKFSWLVCIITMMSLSSCSWEDLPSYEEAEINAVSFRYRWGSTDYKDDVTGEPLVLEMSMGTAYDIDSANGTINVVVTVPAPQSYYTEAVRNQVALNNLCCQVTLSTAARIEPADNHKGLGIPDDWTSPHKFVVTAANGTKKTWTINVTGFNK